MVSPRQAVSRTVAASYTRRPLNLRPAWAVLTDGGFLKGDAADDRVRRVWPDGTISTFAQTSFPIALALMPDWASLVANDGGEPAPYGDGIGARLPGPLRAHQTGATKVG